MPKLDSLKEDIATTREEWKNYFIILMAIATANVTMFYQVMVKNISLPLFFLVIVGVISLIIIAILMKLKRKKLEKYIRELEDLDE